MELNDGDRVETSEHERNVGGNGRGGLGETSDFVSDVHSDLDAAVDGSTDGDFQLLNGGHEFLADDSTCDDGGGDIFFE